MKIDDNTDVKQDKILNKILDKKADKMIDKKISFIGILLFCFLFTTACSTFEPDMEVVELQELETISETVGNEILAEIDEITESISENTVTNLSSSIPAGKKVTPTPTPKASSKKRVTPTPTPKSTSKKKVTLTPTPKATSKKKVTPTSTPKATSKKKVTPTPTPNPTINNKVSLTPKTIKPPKITSGSIEEYTEEILDKIITDEMDDVLKVKAVHDYIVLNTAYDSRNPDNRAFPEESYTEVGVLYQGKAVCQGYALAFQLFMKQLDIEVKFVTGEDLKTGVGHAWNMVKLGKDWYHIDVTWDDPVPDQEGSVQYQYFLVTDKVMAKDHSWDQRDFPECDSTKYQYFVYNDYIVQNIENYDEKFMELYQKGESIITVLYPEKGKPDMSFLLEQKDLRKEENGKLSVSYRYYEPWRLGDYTVFTVKLE